jgi:hypothetical protein
VYVPMERIGLVAGSFIRIEANPTRYNPAIRRQSVSHGALLHH